MALLYIIFISSFTYQLLYFLSIILLLCLLHQSIIVSHFTYSPFLLTYDLFVYQHPNLSVDQHSLLITYYISTLPNFLIFILLSNFAPRVSTFIHRTYFHLSITVGITHGIPTVQNTLVLLYYSLTLSNLTLSSNTHSPITHYISTVHNPVVLLYLFLTLSHLTLSFDLCSLITHYMSTV